MHPSHFSAREADPGRGGPNPGPGRGGPNPDPDRGGPNPDSDQTFEKNEDKLFTRHRQEDKHSNRNKNTQLSRQSYTIMETRKHTHKMIKR